MMHRSDSYDDRTVADVLGLGFLSDDDSGINPDQLRALYAHARGEDGQRVLFERDPTFTRGWVNLDSPRAKELISCFVPLDDADNMKGARRIAQANLEAQAWNDVLGIEIPMFCKIKIHGNKWGLRFQSSEPCLKGKERINDELPAASGSARNAVLPVTTAINNNVGSAAATPNALDILKRGGLPA